MAVEYEMSVVTKVLVDAGSTEVMMLMYVVPWEIVSLVMKLVTGGKVIWEVSNTVVGVAGSVVEVTVVTVVFSTLRVTNTDVTMIVVGGSIIVDVKEMIEPLDVEKLVTTLVMGGMTLVEKDVSVMRGPSAKLVDVVNEVSTETMVFVD